jgi:Tfp pilus assembly protein PilN
MIGEIDFLPASYHRARFKKRRRVWQRGVCFALCAMVGLGVLGERLRQARLEARFDELQEQAHLATAPLRGADAMRREIARLDAKADLLANLQLRIPASGVTSTVVSSMPEHVSLTRLELAYRPISQKRDETARAGKGGGAAPTFESVELADLAKLVEERRQTQPTVRLEGVAPDDQAIAEFLSNLNGCAAFANVRLVFTDGHTHQGQPVRRFEMELEVLRPGLRAAAAKTANAGELEVVR